MVFFAVFINLNAPLLEPAISWFRGRPQCGRTVFTLLFNHSNKTILVRKLIWSQRLGCCESLSLGWSYRAFLLDLCPLCVRFVSDFTVSLRKSPSFSGFWPKQSIFIPRLFKKKKTDLIPYIRVTFRELLGHFFCFTFNFILRWGSFQEFSWELGKPWHKFISICRDLQCPSRIHSRSSTSN